MLFTKKEIKNIEMLKNKKQSRPFGLWPEEFQRLFEKVGLRNCLFFSGNNKWEQKHAGSEFANQMTYVIKSSFKPEEEQRRTEIFEIVENTQDTQDWLGAFIGDGDEEEDFVILRDLPSMNGFVHFFSECV